MKEKSALKLEFAGGGKVSVVAIGILWKVESRDQGAVKWKE
jgi:hypothetical protein